MRLFKLGKKLRMYTCVLMQLLIPLSCLSSDFASSTLKEYSNLEQSLPVSIKIEYINAINVALEEYCKVSKTLVGLHKNSKVNPDDCKKNSDIIFDDREEGYWVIIETNRFNTLSGGMFLIDKKEFTILDKQYFM